jgi:hypothetical protein
MYTNIQQAVASVENAFPSIYTKDDVVKLLTSIEIESPKESSGKLSQDQINDLCRRIVAQVKENAENLDNDCIDKDSAEMSMGYSNTVELDCVEFDTSEVANQVVDGIGDVIETFFEELNEEDEESDDNNETDDSE